MGGNGGARRLGTVGSRSSGCVGMLALEALRVAMLRVIFTGIESL